MERFPDKKHNTVSFEEVTEFIQQSQLLKEKMDVGQEECTWIATGEYEHMPIAITWMPDVHYGNVGVDYEKLTHDLNLIENTPNMGVIFGGDMIDNFNPKKIPDGMLGDAITPQEQVLAWMDRLSHLDRKGKVGAVVWGNHDDFMRVAGIDVFQTFMRELNCPVLASGGGVINTLVGGVNYRIGARHTFWGNSSLNITNAPKRLLQFGYPNLDVGLVGHTHKAAGEMFNLAGEEKIAVTGGTYKTGDHFGKKWGHSPAQGGFTIMLWPYEKQMSLFRTPVDARNALINMVRNSEEDGYEDPYSEMIRKLNYEREQRELQHLRSGEQVRAST